MLGTVTSEIEVTNVSQHGLWLYVRGSEYFLPYSDFPWFHEHPLKSVLKVSEPRENHFFWEDLDVDLSLDMIKHPEKFPNISNAQT